MFVSHSHTQVKNPARRCEECKKTRKTKDNKTTAICDLCLQPTCSMHYVRACQSCYFTKFIDPDELEESQDEEEVEGDSEDDAAGTSTSGQPAKRPRLLSTINL